MRGSRALRGFELSANVFLIWIVNLALYVGIGIVWALAVETRLNRYYFKKWGTFEDDGRPPQRTLWMAPLMYIIMSITDTFLVIIPGTYGSCEPFVCVSAHVLPRSASSSWQRSSGPTSPAVIHIGSRSSAALSRALAPAAPLACSSGIPCLTGH